MELNQLDGLRAFFRRLDAAMTAPQRALAREREAKRIGIDADSWNAVGDARLGLDLLRALHEAVSVRAPRVRRTLRDGSYALARGHAGVFRTKPQAFRIGDHVEPAWEAGQLRGRLSQLFVDLNGAEPLAGGA